MSEPCLDDSNCGDLSSTPYLLAAGVFSGLTLLLTLATILVFRGRWFTRHLAGRSHPGDGLRLPGGPLPLIGRTRRQGGCGGSQRRYDDDVAGGRSVVGERGDLLVLTTPPSSA